MVAPAQFAAVAALLAPAAMAVTNYASDFVDPHYILNFKYNQTTMDAQQTIIGWANQLGKKRPWSVTTKPYLAPTGDPHDYMSWAPYFWPNCSGVGNTTELSVDQMFSQCEYVNVDGKLNPDARQVNNIGDFDDMSNSVFYAAMAWGITRSENYSRRVASLIDTWFLHPDTYMNPNLNYAQMSGGPQHQTGRHTGVLDLKGMIKIASGVLLLREGNADGWNSTIDTKFQDWVNQYISWINSSPIAQDEKASPNNHGSFYAAQLASLYLIVNDTASASGAIDEYFKGIYQGQIQADGGQPLELARTRPYHYLAYNLAAMTTLCHLGEYAGYNGWDSTTKDGGTITKAADFAMNYPVGQDDPNELYPVIGAIAAHLGDPDGKYSSWLNSKTNGEYVSDAAFFWNQPLADSGHSQVATFITFARGGQTGTLEAGARPTGGTADAGSPTSPMPWRAVVLTLATATTFLFLL